MGKFDWATEDIFATDKDWESEYKRIESEISFGEFKGKLGNKKDFLNLMKKQESVGRVIEKLGLYAMLKYNVNTKDNFYDAMENRVNTLSVKYSSETAYVLPELTSLDEKILKDYIKDKDLSDYSYMLKTVLNEKAHVLSEKEEKIMALAQKPLGGFHDIFTKIDNADLPIKAFTFNGKEYPISHGLYGVYLRDDDRGLREKCFKEYYGAYKSVINTIASTYIGSVRKDIFVSSVRGYSSSLNKALCGEDVDEKVYHKLIEKINSALPLLHQYMAKKKKLLNLDQMHMFDIYYPCINKTDFNLEYDDAYNLVIKGLSVLGDEYVSLLKKARDERWIDVYEKDGKKSGAYSAGVYDTHPYVLLNYTKNIHDVFTIAHEMGHSIHTYFSNRTQPYFKADYKIFVAEVASTVNEVLLVRYLIDNANDKEAKKFLYEYLLEMMRTTMFRQTQFAEFEEFSHDTEEKGQPLTKDLCSEKYLELNKKYYGDAVVSDDEIKYEWARIPHFYRAFYVYKYATGIISALSIVDRILTEGKKAIDDYFKFLSSGDSDSPVELLKIAGVDLTTDKPFDQAIKAFSQALEGME